VLKQPAGWVFYDQSFKYLVHLDPNFDYNRHTAVDCHGVVNEAAQARLEACTQAGRGDDPRKLDAFLAPNHKLILFHDHSDGFINPFRTNRFYENWAKLTGGYIALKKNARLSWCGHVPLKQRSGAELLRRARRNRAVVEQGRTPESMITTKCANNDHTQPVQRGIRSRYRDGWQTTAGAATSTPRPRKGLGTRPARSARRSRRPRAL
jgi:hypothetical protein